MKQNSQKSYPLIGLTTYHRNEAGYIKLPGQYADAVRRAGGIPVLIQPGETHFPELLSNLDGLVFTGGGDLDPATYQGSTHEQIYFVSEERDTLEFELIKHLFDEPKPTLCICRGLQILNIYLGGTLIEHIEETTVQHRAPPRNPISHTVTLKPSSRLANIIQATEFGSESWHHQAIKTLGEKIEVVGHAKDGIIEAVEIDDAPWLMAVQWHPELTAETDVLQQRLFNELIRQACSQTTSSTNRETRKQNYVRSRQG